MPLKTSCAPKNSNSGNFTAGRLNSFSFFCAAVLHVCRAVVVRGKDSCQCSHRDVMFRPLEVWAHVEACHDPCTHKHTHMYVAKTIFHTLIFSHYSNICGTPQKGSNTSKTGNLSMHLWWRWLMKGGHRGEAHLWRQGRRHRRRWRNFLPGCNLASCCCRAATMNSR